MKQKIFGKNAISGILFFALSMSVLFAADILLDAKDLPQEVHSYVQTHFPEASITLAVKDTEGMSHTYELKLDNRIELDFNAKGEITAIDGNGKLPDSVIPEKILSYVQMKFPKNHITDWTLESGGQEIELDNGLELKFNRKGNFIKIDK